MFCRILAIFAISLTITTETNAAPALATARQFLPALPGYIPVYIRTGDTPLEDINPNLAAAFDSYAQKHARLAFGRSLDELKDQDESSSDAKVAEVKGTSLSDLYEDLSVDDDNDVSVSSPKPIVHELEHIQKIPRS